MMIDQNLAATCFQQNEWIDTQNIPKLFKNSQFPILAHKHQITFKLFLCLTSHKR